MHLAPLPIEMSRACRTSSSIASSLLLLVRDVGSLLLLPSTQDGWTQMSSGQAPPTVASSYLGFSFQRMSSTQAVDAMAWASDPPISQQKLTHLEFES